MLTTRGLSHVAAAVAVLAIAPFALAGAASMSPSAEVWTTHSWNVSTSGDSIAAIPYLGEDWFHMRYAPTYGSIISGAAVEIHMPMGCSSPDQWGGMYMNWDGINSVFRWTAVGDISTSRDMHIDTPYTRPDMNDISVTRSVSSPILTGTSTVQLLRMDLQINSTLPANFLQVSMVNNWEHPAGIQYDFLSAAPPPTGFVTYDNGQSFQAMNPAGLGPGTYSFMTAVNVTRSGARDDGQPLYHKPSSSVQYGISQTLDAWDTTAVTHGVAGGVTATYLSQDPVNFTGWFADQKELSFGAVVEKVTNPTPTSIMGGLITLKNIAGQTTYGAHLEVQGDGIVAARLFTPTGRPFDMGRSDDDMVDLNRPSMPSANPPGWSFDFESPVQSDLADFVPGTYTIHLFGATGAETVTGFTLLGAGATPGLPIPSKPDGYTTTDTTPTLVWTGGAGETQSGIWIEGGNVEVGQDPGAGRFNSFTPTDPLAAGGYLATFGSFNPAVTSSAGVPVNFFNGSMTDTLFNVHPGPVPPTGVNGVRYAASSFIDWDGDSESHTQVADGYAPLPLDETSARTSAGTGYMGGPFANTIGRSRVYYDQSNAVHHVVHALAYAYAYGGPVQGAGALTISRDIVVAPTADLPAGTPIYARGTITLSGKLLAIRGDPVASVKDLKAQFNVDVDLLGSGGANARVFSGGIILQGDDGGRAPGGNWIRLVLAGDLNTPAILAALTANWSLTDSFASLLLDNLQVPYRLPINVGETFTLDVTFTALAYAPDGYGLGSEVAFGEDPVLNPFYVPDWYGFGQVYSGVVEYGNMIPEPSLAAVLAVGTVLLRRRRA